MDINWDFIEPIVYLVWLGGAVAFVLGLIRMNSPATARNGNLLSAGGMALAIAATAVLLLVKPENATPGGEEVTAGFNAVGWLVIIAGIALGGGLGLYTARTVKMTAMPQLVSLFNAVGGGAAALIALDEYLKFASKGTVPGLQVNVATVLDVVIGSITFTGSLIASGKLMGLRITPSRPVMIPGGQLVTGGLALITVLGALYLWAGNVSLPVMAVILVVALIFGVTMTLPIGGADMPVVISLLNSYAGLASAATGFAIRNNVLIIAGALDGASGFILSIIMSRAMNRSFGNVLFGAFGAPPPPSAASATDGLTVHAITPEDAALQLAFARLVIVVPGYGMAVAQAQHQVRELANLIEKNGGTVLYAIHPVAGRMPGHMNVLLAEADIPYDKLKEMDEINDEFKNADAALVIGANDVVNPAARTDRSSPIYGMPILNVDQAKQVIVLKRSMNPGFAGIENQLFYAPNTAMLFGDAKASLAKLVHEIKQA